MRDCSLSETAAAGVHMPESCLGSNVFKHGSTAQYRTYLSTQRVRWTKAKLARMYASLSVGAKSHTACIMRRSCTLGVYVVDCKIYNRTGLKHGIVKAQEY
jgi:hypothetical protein